MVEALLQWHMKKNNSNNQALQILSREYDRISSDIRAIESTNDKVVGLGLTIIGVGFTYGIQHNINEVFLFLPVALIGVFLYATLQYHNMFWFGGYKRALEEAINQLSGQTLVYWESLIQSRRKRVHLINTGLVAIYLLILVASTGFSVFRTFEAMGFKVGAIFSLVVLVLLVILFFSVRQMFGAYQKSLDLSREALLSQL